MSEVSYKYKKNHETQNWVISVLTDGVETDRYVVKTRSAARLAIRNMKTDNAEKTST